MIGRRRRPRFPSMATGGRIVHLADRDGQPACGQDTCCPWRVPGRITCVRCVARCPEAAARHAHRRLVLYANLDPIYAEIGRALEAGAQHAPRRRAKPIPVFVGDWYLGRRWYAHGRQSRLVSAGF